LNPHIVTLPQHFIAHGYNAAYSGKIFHGGMTDEQHSWNYEPNRKGLQRPTTHGHMGRAITFPRRFPPDAAGTMN
ncbi:MAG TPA: hypothetical protein EYQ63_20730, partial [Fuerstia sp.]|nr:hypothetical protein [Fuerstiella sp.]